MDTELRNNEIITPDKTRSFFKIFIVPVVIIVGSLSLLIFASLPPSSFPNDQIITITEGQTLKDIAKILKDSNYIRSKTLFASLVTALGGERSISRGDYYFEKPVSVFVVSSQIARGIHNVNQIKITIPEGQNSTEIVKTLQEKIPELNISEFREFAKRNEGYLFPETYFFFASVTPTEVIEAMKLMFARKTQELFLGKTEKQIEQIIILASLVEREARGTDDRALIAGILTKRLSLRMPLQVDATVAYANGIDEGDLKKSHFGLISPYNTYVVKGLPPTAISNPGLPAIMASINPTETDYLYYLHDKRGNIHYAKTYKEHLANIARYLR
ncbi:MAG: endolytic transglycosylase MltG [Candidatus Pacebacteria bacterium]|nr:endolytic transglycosylase MltG [Candidatus Paceibacterota bacterium]